MSDEDDHRSELLSYATKVAKADDVQTVYEAMCEAVQTVFDFSSAVVEAEDDGMLTVRSWTGRAPSVDSIAVEDGIAGETFRRGESIIVEDAETDPRVDDPPAKAPRSVMSVPVGDIGVLQAGMDEPGGFDQDDVEIAELLAYHAVQVIERIQSEREVRENEARFRKLFEQTDDALVLYDVDPTGTSRVRLANDTAESLVGTPEAGLSGETLTTHFTAERDQFVPGETAQTFETRLADDGDSVFEVTVKPFLRQDGPDAFATVTDITEQHHREHILTELHDATRRMLVEDDTNEIGDVVIEAAGNLLGLPYVAVFFAADDEPELRPASVSDQVASDDTPVLRAGESLAWDVFEAGEPDAFGNLSDQENVHNPDTTLREEIIHPLGDHGVLLVGSKETDQFSRRDRDLIRVLATNAEAALDRAEHVRQLRHRESDLRRERNRLAALFENVPSPTASFVVQDGNPVLRSLNPAFEDVFGYGQAELEGQNIDEYIVPPERETEAGVYNEKLVEGKNVNVEVRRLAEDGIRDFLLDVVPFRLDERNVHGFAMYTDITERKERERELERQNDRLEEFASIVSHDLRNPLNVARGYLELAEQTGDDEYFERMDESLERMHDIIESVLALARHGRSLDDTHALSLSDATERAWGNVETGDATLEVCGNCTLEADPSRFGSLLENLFGNAVEHGSTNPPSQAHEDAGEHPSADITVTVGELDAEAGFYVADDGRGIPPEYRDDVFAYGESRNDEGTGFGLAIVKSVAEAHSWTPEIAVGDEGGARFEFRT